MPFTLTISDDVWPRVVAALCVKHNYQEAFDAGATPEKPEEFAERMIRDSLAMSVADVEKQREIADAVAAAEAKRTYDLTAGIITTGTVKVG